MKQVQWTDQDGYLRRSILRDNDDESKPEYGVPIGPPNIQMVDWEGVKREVNNVLVQESISTWADLTASQSAMSFISNVLKRHIAALYRELGK